MAVDFQAGLRDVIAVASGIADVDGQVGRLRYRGYDIADLSAGVTYEEVTDLLWTGEFPRRRDREQITRELTEQRRAPEPVLEAMRQYPRSAHPLEALRAALSVHVMHDPDTRDHSPQANRRKSVRLTAQMATLVAAWARIRDGKPVIPPDPALSHAGNFLWMLRGEAPDRAGEEAMNAVLVLHAEHELNASTFAARLVVGTVSDLHSAVIAALSALKGPRHGGANEDVLAMLEEIGTPEHAESYIRARLDTRARMSRAERADPSNRIPGWGHAVYKVHDPRAARLRDLGRRVAEQTGGVRIADVADVVHHVMSTETDLPVNVDFFSAVVYHALAIPIDQCTSIFAVSRIAGWCAHIMEQFGDNRLIRPRVHYTGPPPRAFVPMEARG
ncbi:MAG: citrate/2-methylcitrate synthase [Armatimonadota bacterium]